MNDATNTTNGRRRRAPIALITSGSLLLVMVAVAVFGPMVADRGPNDQDLTRTLLVPGRDFLLGTDQLGRDMVARVAAGLRLSLVVAALALVIQLVIGTPLGIIAGYYRGPIDAMLMRLSDVAFAIPFYLLAIVLGSSIRAFESDGTGGLASFIGSTNERSSGLLGLIVALTIVFTPLQARLVRGYVIDVANKDYVRAALTSGCSHLRILVTHVLPHVAAPAIVIAVINVPTAIVVEAGVSILGLGVSPPTASLGSLLQSGSGYITSFPHLLLVPAVTLGLVVLAVNTVADALQFELDPLSRRRRLAPLTVEGPPPPDEDDAANPALLKVRGLCVEFAQDSGTFRAVDRVSLTVQPGERVAIVGESGSGKTVLSRAILGLVQPPGQVTAGSIRWRGVELRPFAEDSMSMVRGSQIAMVFQDPISALDPLGTVGSQIAEVVRLHSGSTRRVANARVLELLADVGLPDPVRVARRYPHELSGGQRQRAMLAVALAGDPALLIADEPTTALDVTIQAQILELLVDLSRQRGLALVLVTHDLGIVVEYCDRVVVMRNGRVVEELPSSALADDATDPYTRELVASVPAPIGTR